MRGAALVTLIACSGSSTPGATGSGSGSATIRFAGIAAMVEREVPDTTSVLVMQHGAIVYEAYFNGADARTLHDTRSTTKTITALAVGAALDTKILPGLSARAFDYVADIAPANLTPAKREITIEDLMTMSSALDCDDNVDTSPGNEENMYPQKVWLRWAADLPTRTDYARDARGRGPWHYCTAGTFLLGQIVERAAKQPIDQWIGERIFKPLGITRWEFSRSPSGEAMTGGGLRLTTRDLGKLGRMIHAGGGGIVSTEFIRAMQTMQVHTTFKPDTDYGYLMWGRDYTMSCGKTRTWRMSGNGGNTVAVLADLDAIVVVTRTHYNSKGMHDQTAKMIEDQILPELGCNH